MLLLKKIIIWLQEASSRGVTDGTQQAETTKCIHFSSHFLLSITKKAVCNCDPDQLKEVQGVYFFNTVPKVTYYLLSQIKDSSSSLEKGLLNLFNSFYKKVNPKSLIYWYRVVQMYIMSAISNTGQGRAQGKCSTI